MRPVAIRGRLDRGDFDLTLDLTVRPGEVTVVLGPNGSGKTTLLRGVAGLEALSDGSLTLGERVLDDGGPTFVSAHERPVALVFQEHRLFPHLSVHDNLAFAARTGGLSLTDNRRPITAASRRPQARTSRRAGILVTAADDRGLGIDTGSPPFGCCDEGR